ncbi:MAG: hypothetical protein ACRD22_22345 [Terriglobia bacterium]
MDTKTAQTAQRNNGISGRKTRRPTSTGKSPREKQLQELVTTARTAGAPTPAATLRYVFEESMGSMIHGDIILLDGTESLREVVDVAFFAILACPFCGKLDLVTQAQLSGTDTVICGYEDCACHFRINGRREIGYLPVN